MFQYKMPRFTAQRVLSREILFTMRDLSCQLHALYGEYSDGILTGCGLYEENGSIGVRPGVVKYAERFYVLEKPELTPFQPTGRWTVLKIRFSTPKTLPDFEYAEGRLALEDNTHVGLDELELCRFKLKQGSALRSEYKDFADMGTEYDTVNLLYRKQAFRGGAALCPEITQRFAREAFPLSGDNPLDHVFCGQCLAAGEAVSREYAVRYVCGRTGAEYRDMENPEVYQRLLEILETLRNKSRMGYKKKPGDRHILLD